MAANETTDNQGAPPNQQTVGDPPPESDTELRQGRQLTERGVEMYQENRSVLFQQTMTIWDEIEEVLIEVSDDNNDIHTLKSNERKLKTLFQEYKNKCERFLEFLRRANNTESVKELPRQTENFNRSRKTVENVLTNIHSTKLDRLEIMSQASSNSSTKRLQSEVSKAALMFKRKEAVVLRKKAMIQEELGRQAARTEREQTELEIDLDLIKQEHETAVKEIENETEDNQSLDSRSVTDREEFTREFVRTLNMNKCDEQVKSIHSGNRPTANTNIKVNDVLNPAASSYVPNHTVTDLSQFLLKKDLQLSRFVSFNDKAENYAAWKASFHSITTNLQLSAIEEMDLLAKYLGPESSRFANSIRSSNANNPEKGKHEIWDRLEQRYGRPEMVETALKQKLKNFPKINKDYTKLYDLVDVLSEIESVKQNEQYTTLLSYFDSSSGVTPIVNKLPVGIQDKWAFRAAKYKRDKNVPYPPFSFFISFIRELSEMKNDPSFVFENTYSDAKPKQNVYARKQDVATAATVNFSVASHTTPKRCPIHHADHSLNNCRAFSKKPIEERKDLLKKERICFKCCESYDHIARNCTATVKCIHCSKNHASAMHIENFRSGSSYGGERPPPTDDVKVGSKCTQLCGDKFIGKSCSKTVLVDVYPVGHPELSERIYAIIDDQSNRTLAKQELFDKLQMDSELTEYTLSSCSGKVTAQGRRASGLCVRSVDGHTELRLPPIIECDDIPSEMSEIPTPEVAEAYPHLRHLASKIPHLDSSRCIQLLIGRDLPEAHHIKDQVTGRRGMPFAQRLSLGWVVIGEVCRGKVHQPDIISTKKTSIMSDGRATIFDPCRYNLQLRERFSSQRVEEDAIFQRTEEDDRLGLSTEDRQFLHLMEEKMVRDEEGFWTAPLPFKTDVQGIPINRQMALKRAKLLHTSLEKNSKKREHFIAFMEKVLKNGAAEPAPRNDSGNCYYLPLFGVYHPRKPDQLRGVFDSSAVYEGVSLNTLLMSGPDLINSLVGILLRFRKDAYAITGDVEQMFYRFRVSQEHRDFLRFFWYRNNDPKEPLIEYRMRVHVFGNTASPAVATYGLHRAVQNADKAVQDFVNNNFYVDDALTSKPSPQEAIDLMKNTQAALKDGGNIRLHKIASNSVDVMEAFPSEDLGSDFKDLNIYQDCLPVQTSLGISWDLKEDVFIFHTALEDKPFTRRGLLSMVNSIFDPLGFIAPITISGKILLREATPHGVYWDAPLSEDHKQKWIDWRESLQNLQEVATPRMFTNISVSTAAKIAVYIFSDASEKAVAAVAYIKLWNNEGDSSVGFLFGKAKLAPTKGHTIPRLELCGAVLATEIAETISTQLDIPKSMFTFFTDSKVVLGYICNQTRRFYTYVSNRVEKILKVSSSSQWKYIPTDKNPADCATRCSTGARNLQDGLWFSGPKLLNTIDKEDCIDLYPLVEPVCDKELRPEVSVLKTTMKTSSHLGCERFKRFSSWASLVRAVVTLKTFIRSHKKKDNTSDSEPLTVVKDAESVILREVQKECFQDEISRISANRNLQKDSKIINLSPFLDNDGVLRVGGRLNRLKTQNSGNEVNPIILQKNHYVSSLLIRQCHESVKHQGRILTEGALRSAGYWLIGAKRMISSILHSCVTCRRLRGSTEQQIMADLPEDRLTPGPPFTSVGVDVFGPWQVLTRKTRGGAANSKRWAALFTCMTTRAVHIEVIEEMSSSCFINALRRFLSIRGPVKIFRSDRGTNFVGALDDLNINAIKVQDSPVQRFLHDSGINWIFNAPHSSHMGGVWERMIGLARKVLDSIMFESRHNLLTHETITTFMAEVAAILNNRPLGQISTDPSSPMVLRPSMLLTGKADILPEVSETIGEKDAFKAQWKRVQLLADTFWRIWRRDYLHLLQTRQKWHHDRPNLKEGDVVLLKDAALHRNHWSLGIVNHAFESSDSKVRKVEVRVAKDSKIVTYVRPVNEVVLLLA